MGQDATSQSSEMATPNVTDELQAPEAEMTETPEIILANLSKALKDTEGVDADLASILTEHLLTTAPHASAVSAAKAAIGALAAKRAALTQNSANG